MERRTFLALLAGAAVASPLPVSSQQLARGRRVAFLALGQAGEVSP